MNPTTDVGQVCNLPKEGRLQTCPTGRLAQALEEYRALLEAGAAPDRATFLARHPEIADELAECLSGLEFVHAVAPALSGAGEPGTLATGDGLAGTLGDFRIVREVGRGGMGIVYEAEQISLGRRVALKVLPFAATMDPRHLQRFHNEARAAASLDHPYIVKVHAVGCERAVHFYAMQFIDGQTLAGMIADLRQRGGKAPLPEVQPTTPHVPGTPTTDTAERAAASTERTALDRTYFHRVAEWGIQAAEALDHAHQLGIVHRDVKPANLLVDGRGGLWVTDFGLAHMQSDTRLTMTGDLVGTLRYMSPEQALAKRVVIDHRTDVYSLGVTLYELLTLEPAYAGQDRQELLRQIAFEEPRQPRRLNKSIPMDLETIVFKAMEKNPQDRYATSKELAEDLERYRRDEPIRGRRPSLLRRARKWGQRHRATAAATAVCLLVTLAALIGSMGWSLGDRAARRKEAEREAERNMRETLAVAELGLRQGNPYDPALIAALQRTEEQLRSGMVGQDLRRQIEQLRKDVQVLAELERIRLDQSVERDGHFDRAGAASQYGIAFREYGIDMESLGSQEVAARVQGSAIRQRLVAGLDEWADVLMASGNAPKAKQLVDVTRQVDPDLWRDRLREVMLSGDFNDLEQLARSAPVEELSASTLALLGYRVAWSGRQISVPMLEPLRRAQQRFPADFWVNYLLAHALMEVRPPQLEEAIGFYRASVAVRPQSAGTHNNLGVALSYKGQPDEAIAEFREAIRLTKDSAMAHSNLGSALRDKGQLDEAIAECREAIRLKKDYPEPHCNLANALYDKGQWDEAIVEYREAIRLNKDFAMAHSNFGKVLRAKGQLDEAIAEYREAIRLKEDFADAHFSLGSALQLKGKVEEAIVEYREAIRLNKDFVEAHSNLGAVLREKGQLDEAIAECREALRLKKDSPMIHDNLGGALQLKGKVEEAIVEYREAIRLNKDYAKAHYNLGIALFDKGQLDEAIVEYREAIRLKKEDAAAHNNLGNALQLKGKVEEAIVEYREAIRLKKDDSETHYNLGFALYSTGDLEAAIAEYREAIRLNKDDLAAHSNLGTALCDKGLWDEAIAEYREAIRLKKEDAAAHNNLGNALRLKGQPDQAIAEFREAIRLKKDFANAHFGLSQALLGQGHFDEARTATRRCLELLPERHPLRQFVSQELQQCEQALALEKKLAAILEGKKRPSDDAERLVVAWVCQQPFKKLYAASARFYAEAFANDSKLADDLEAGRRYDAACAAALAGCGQGEDADGLDEKKRTALRQQALDWLRADLTAYRRLLEKEPNTTGPAVTGQLAHWLEDTDLAGVRALDKLPEAERPGWQKLWADVADTLTQAKRKTTPETKPAPK